MGYLSFTAILCVYLILHVQSKSSPYQESDDPSRRAKDELIDLEMIITVIVNIAIEAIDGLESSIKVIQKLAVSFAQGLINRLGDEIFQKLDELKKEANAIGVDIINCTEAREEDIKELFVVFVNQTSDCVVERIDEVLDSLSVIVTDIKDANTELRNLTRRLDDCGSDPECLAQVINDIAILTVDVPAEIKQDIMIAERKVRDLEDYLFECEKDNYNELQIKAQEIFNGIVECVESKLNPVTTTSSPPPQSFEE